jgi:hypothetical protein
MRPHMTLPVAIAVAALLVAGSIVVGSASPEISDPEGQLMRAADASSAHVRREMTLERFRFMGHSALDGFGDYGDVWGHGDFAYVGTRCGEAERGGDGVQVIRVVHPRYPQLVSTLANPSFTRAEDVVVIDVETGSFSGALAVVGIQSCGGTEVVPGLRFFDVTDPTHPALLGHWDLPEGTVGCHEIDAVQRADGMVLAGCARSSIDHDVSLGKDSVHIVDATDPSRPRTLADWTLGANPIRGVGWLPKRFAHSVRFEDRGTSLYVSNWDAGTVNLDISNPRKPVIVAKTKIVPPDEDGDNHSMTLAAQGRWLIINTEDFSPAANPGKSKFGTWGEVYVYDNRDPVHTRLLGTFSTENSRSTRTDGVYTDHNTEVVKRDQLFSSWYSDGVVWWTMNGRGVTHQLGQFVPPGSPFVWGVYPLRHRRLILASDLGTGLWIVRPKGLKF